MLKILKHSRDLTHELEHDLVRYRKDHLDRGGKRNQKGDHNIDIARRRAQVLDLAFDRYFVHALDLETDRDIAHKLIVNPSRSFSSKFRETLDRNLERNLAQNLILKSANILGHALDLSLDPALNRNLALDLSIDIFTLEERIQGRSPAFEGIRLVKERIR